MREKIEKFDIVKNCQNSLTGFQTLTHVSFSKPFHFVIVTHESDGLGETAMASRITEAVQALVGDAEEVRNE